MPCFSPLVGWPGGAGKPLVWSPGKSYAGANRIEIACGQCLGCRVQKAMHWTTRMVGEAKSHDATWFLTCTVAPEHYPARGYLLVRDHQLFMKRFRKAFGQCRFVVVHEHGEETWRSHFHYIVYSVEFSDLRSLRLSKSGVPLYASDRVDALWKKGMVSIQPATPEAMAYVAGYQLKKITGDAAGKHYTRPHADEPWRMVTLPAPWMQSSRRPGVGGAFFDKFTGDVFPSGFLVVNGKKTGAPAAWKRRYLDEDPEAGSALLLTAREKSLLPLRAKGLARAHEIERRRADGSWPSLETEYEALRLRVEANRRDFAASFDHD